MRRPIMMSFAAALAAVAAVPGPAGADELCESVTVLSTTLGDCVMTDTSVVCTTVAGDTLVGATVCVPLAVQLPQPNTAR